MRLLLPGYQGNMNVKFLRRLKVVDQPAMSMFESKTYSQLLPDGKRGGFHFLQEVKSFITQPSFGAIAQDAGYYQISGVAYSGNGRIAKVMVSADGGKSWGDAALRGPVQSARRSRGFDMPWRWDGQPAVLQSGAWDEAGNAQPLRKDFVAARGETKKPVTNPLGFPISTTTASRAGASQHWGDQACLRVRPCSPLRWSCHSVLSRSRPTRRNSASRSPTRISPPGTSPSCLTAPDCPPAAERLCKALSSMRRSASPVMAKAARAAARPALGRLLAAAR